MAYKRVSPLFIILQHKAKFLHWFNRQLIIMKASFVFFIFCFIFLFPNLNHARKDPRDYWESVMKDQPMPDAIKGLLPQDQAGNKMKNFVKDFDSRHSLIIYHTDIKHKDEDRDMNSAGKETKNFVKDFEHGDQKP